MVVPPVVLPVVPDVVLPAVVPDVVPDVVPLVVPAVVLPVVVPLPVVAVSEVAVRRLWLGSAGPVLVRKVKPEVPTRSDNSISTISV